MKEYDFPYAWISRDRRSKCLPCAASSTGIRVSFEEELDDGLIAMVLRRG